MCVHTYIHTYIHIHTYTHWLKNNNLLLNHNKTELLNITNDPNNYFPDIIINQHKIIPTNSVKYIGVNFYNKLNLDKHYRLLNLQLRSYLILNRYDHT